MSRSRALSLTTLAVLCLAAGAEPSAGVEPAAMRAEAERFEALMRSALDKYAAGKGEDAIEAVGDAFFAFEDSDFHRALIPRAPALYKGLEAAWLEVRGRMSGGASATEVASSHARWLALLAEARGAVDGSDGGVEPFVSSLLILLREGFECILVISALAAWLRRTEHARRVRDLYLGSAAALLASGALWIAARSVIRVSGADQEVLEGVTMLIATAVLFVVSYWLISKVEGRKWQQFITRKMKATLGHGGRFGLGFLAFVVVFREGFETILFYEALIASSPPGAGAGIAGGVAVALCLLVAIYGVFIRAGRRLPLRPFFSVTGGLLYLLAFKFLGNGLRELQEGGVLGVTPVDWVPRSAFLQDWLGIHPSLETTAAQAVLLVLALAALAVAFRGAIGTRSDATPETA